MMKKKKSVEPSKVSDAESSANASKQCEEVPPDNVEVVANTRVRRGKRNSQGGTDANEAKKRVKKASVSESASDTADEVLDDEADDTEPSVTKPDIVVSEVANDDVADPTQMANKEECEATSEPGSNDTNENLDYVADGDSAAAESSEEVSNETALDNVIIGDDIVGTTGQSKVSTEASEEVADTSEESEEVTLDYVGDGDSAAGESSEEVSNETSIVDKDAVVEATEQSKVSTEASEEVAATSEQAEEVTTETLDNTNDVSKAVGSTTTSQSDILLRKIFVGGLPNTITEDQLEEYFETFGRVIHIELLRYRDTNRTRGFAFVVFEDKDCANKCIQQRSHEICKKVCEVRKVDKNKLVNNSVGDSRRSPVYNNRNNLRQNQQLNTHGAAHNGVGIQQMFQRAFLIGQQSLYRPPVQTPPTPFLLNRAAAVNQLPATLANRLPAAVHPSHNILLQALINRQVAQASAHVRPMVGQGSAYVRPMVGQVSAHVSPMVAQASAHVRSMVARASAPMVAPVVRTAPGNIAALNLLAQHMKAYGNTPVSNRGPTNNVKHIYRPY